ncbi:(3S,6E)-nerolidol synthase 1-like isoform X2 [Prosopis cineraria]|uniref:(3S,6E)-nerolidol synthase 1-like isoform X2 n=1 Tax=Prosopis cineraria TaxID=364024 RepID=UPI00240EB49E|nr:(3S,6E)-nerolidol synthase 1-like isoform X2 [Prosopis cineraria]
MALINMKSSIVLSSNPHFPSTKAELSAHRSSSFRLHSLPTANKWIISDKSPSTPFTNSDHLCHNLEGELKLCQNALKNVGENSLKGLQMVDAMHRLNIAYHFQEEINEFLAAQHTISGTYGSGYGHDHLHEVALRFRLLRQQGHYVPAEVFEKFTGKEGKFNQKVGEDIKGMIDLYEASQLRMEGEAILDEAEQFGGKILKERSAYLSADKAEFVRRTLEQPFHRSLPIFTSRNFFQGSHGMNGWVNALQGVAKMNFNLLQSAYQTEIIHISKWWTELGLANELKYARNQPLKWYIWSLACLTDPSFSEERVELTKPISFIYLMDDIFDIYGTLEELTLFTKAVTRWDIEATEKLPDYMKMCFKAVYDVTNEISYKWGRLCEAFLIEAKWFASGKMPSAEEYLKNGIVSSGVHVVLVHIFFLLGQRISQETVQKIDNNPTIISSTATILRLWDDLGSAEDENQEGKDGSYMECVMKEMMEEERATEVVMGKISEAWKSLHREFVLDDTFGSSFRKASLNLARMVPLMYSYDHNQCLPKLESQVKSLLYDQVLL